jgi:hypothetical protein
MELYIGIAIGALTGFLAGSAYDHWRVASIVDNAILKYRVEEEKRKVERFKKFLNESEEDGCESE